MVNLLTANLIPMALLAYVRVCVMRKQSMVVMLK